MMHREVLHQRVLARLTAVDWKTNYHEYWSLYNIEHNTIDQLQGYFKVI